MVSVRTEVTQGPGLSLRAWMRDKTDGVVDKLPKVMDEVVREGEAAMEGFISTRGTAKSGKRGRIETGEMLRSVSSRSSATSNGAEGEFGWLGQNPKYSLYQEYGFEHYLSGEWIEGMFALGDAFMGAQSGAQAKLFAMARSL